MESGQRNVELSDPNFNHIFKLLLIGDSGVGKSSLLLRFTANTFEEISPTIGVDFKVQTMRLDDMKIKLVVWDTAGQERFRTLTSSYYRGAQGVILVYDVSKRDTFKALADTWLREVELYSTNADCVKVLVGNKVDIDERQVSREEGVEFAKAHGCLFLECSAKTKLNVEQVFEELVRKILETPSLVQVPEHNEKKVSLSQDSSTSSSTCVPC